MMLLPYHTYHTIRTW